LIDNYIETDFPQIKEAISTNFPAMILVSPEKTAAVIVSNNELMSKKNEFLKGCTRLQQYLFLKALLQVEDSPTKEDLMELFSLICEFDPGNTKQFLSAHSSQMDLEQSQKICEKKGIIESSVEILKDIGDFSGAVKQIGGALENALLDYIESERSGNVEINSIDEIAGANEPELNHVYQTIRVAIDLLISTREEKGNDLQWQNMFQHFQFPLYHLQTDKKFKGKDGIKKTVTMLFSFFVVEEEDAGAFSFFSSSSFFFAGSSLLSSLFFSR